MKTKTMLNLMLGLSCLTLAIPAFSMGNTCETCMSQVSMHFTAESWVDSQTSLVSIGLRASIPSEQVDNVTQAIKTKLAKASKVNDWRLVNLTRKEGESGLMALTGQAVARLNNNELSALQAQLKALNKPGEKYSIDDVDYQPDLHVLNQARTELRANLYTKIIQGQKELNTALPGAKASYQIHTINFNDVSMPEPVAYAAGNVRMAKSNHAGGDSRLSGKMRMSANVTYSAPTPHCDVARNAQ
jgi:hypothetical protein